MFDALFPGKWLDGLAAALRPWLIPAAVAAAAYLLWRGSWRSRYLRLMRRTFDAANLYVKPKKDKLFPQLISLSSAEDDLYYVFRYRLRPGMTVSQFEDKKKWIEAAFHADTKVFGKGGVVVIKVKKDPHPLREAN